MEEFELRGGVVSALAEAVDVLAEGEEIGVFAGEGGEGVVCGVRGGEEGFVPAVCECFKWISWGTSRQEI